MPSVSGWVNTGAAVTVNLRIPRGSTINFFYIISENSTHIENSWVIQRWFFGHGVYAIASITQATHRLYLYGKLHSGATVYGGNMPYYIALNPNITSVDNDAFLYLDNIAANAPTSYNVFYCVGWDLPQTLLEGNTQRAARDTVVRESTTRPRNGA